MAFKSYDDSWIQQDLPWDAEVLEILKSNWEGVWDDCVPAVQWANPLIGAFDEQTARRFSHTEPLCIWSRVWLLLPGTNKLHAHVAYRVGGIEASSVDYEGSLFFSQSQVSLSQPIGLGISPTGDDFKLLTESVNYGSDKLTIDYSVEVERPRLTLLQLWWRSTSDNSDALLESSTGGFPQSPEGNRKVISDNVTGFSGGTAAANAEEQTHYVYQGIDGSGNVLSEYNIWHYGSALYDSGSTVADSSIDSYYLTRDVDKNQPGIAGVQITPIAYIELLSVAIEVERDPDYLYMPRDAYKEPEKYARPQIMDAFTSGAESVLKRRRPISFGPFPMQGEEPSVAYNVDGIWVTPLMRREGVVYETGFCMVPVYEHAKLHFAGIMLAWTSVPFVLEISIRKASATTPFSYINEIIQVEKPFADDVPGVMRFWQQPTGFSDFARPSTVEGAFLEEDVDRLLGEVVGTRIVGGELNIPDPDTYGGSGQPEPLVVQINVSPIYEFDYNNETSGPFEVGEILTINGDICRLLEITDNGTTGVMKVSAFRPGFAISLGEIISGGTSGASADVNSGLDFQTIPPHSVGMLPFFWTEEL